MQSQALSRLHLTALARLIRLPLALMVTVTAVAGALAAGPPPPEATLRALAWGTFLLAAASSALNQVQERASDALMRRTCRRPLASGLLSAASGTTIGLLLASGGLTVLLVGTGLPTAILGLSALTWYLAIYTPLKRVSPLAVLAGTPCGAVPPLMGWLAAGGTLPAPQPLALALFMLLWQVPHYWLLALPERGELAAAGFRVLPSISDYRLLTLSRRWLFSLVLSTALLPALQLPAAPLWQKIIGALAMALAVTTILLCRKPLFVADTARHLRRFLHIYLALVLLTLLAGAVIHSLP